MLEFSISQIHNKVDKGELTYEALVAYYIGRVETLNDKVNAVSELNPNALEQAKTLDREYRSKGRRSDLHGIPIMIKDNINIASDGLHTTAGAFVFEGLQAPYDATIVKKLKEAGAIILGKTNLSEFANFISEDSPNGYSALKDQVLNPYGEYDVGGSSSGSGVATTMGFCQVAIGTETSGSIISPSHSNSIYGLKPTVGVVSRYGIVPISGTQDVPGPMARHIEDLRCVEAIIEGLDDKDTSTIEGMKAMDRSWNEPSGIQLNQLRLGIYIHQEYANDRLEANEHFAGIIKKLEAAGVYTEEVNFDKKSYVIDWDVLYYEFPKDLKTYLATMGDSVNVKDLAEVIDFNVQDLAKRVPYDQKQFETSLNKTMTYEEDYERALRDSFKYGSLMDQWMSDKNLDGVCYVNCDGIDIAARKGHPSVTMPVGYDRNGTPVGFTITGPMFSEPELLALADLLEGVIGQRKQLYKEIDSE